MSAWLCEFGGNHTATVFCACKRTLTKLCTEHFASHQEKSLQSSLAHEPYPIEAIADYQTPGYMQRLKQREEMRHYAEQELKANLDEIDRCIAAFSAEINIRIQRLQFQREMTVRELVTVKETLQQEVDECIQEVKGCRFLDHPNMTSRYTPVVRQFTRNCGDLTVFHYFVESDDCAVDEILRYKLTAPKEKPLVEELKGRKTMIRSEQLLKEQGRLQHESRMLEANVQKLKAELNAKCKETDAKIMEVDRQLRSFAVPSLSNFEIESLFKQSWLFDEGTLTPEFRPYTISNVNITSVRQLSTAAEVVTRFVNYAKTLSPANCRLLWHGTSSVKCRDGTCNRRDCSCCGIARSGFLPECARQNTASYSMFGPCAYFSSRSINSHSYNGQNEEVLGRGERAMLLCYVALGNSLDLYEYAKVYEGTSDKRKYFRSRMGRDPLEHEMSDFWPRSLSSHFHSFHAYIRICEIFDNYMIPQSGQVLPLYLVTYRYPEVFREKLPTLLQGDGTTWCQFHHMRHSSDRDHYCDNYAGYRSHRTGADFCTETAERALNIKRRR